MAIVLLFSALLPVCGFSQMEYEYDEINVTVNVERVGVIEMQAVIENEMAYLPVSDLFNYLKINNTPSSGSDYITGYIISQQAAFLIDKVHNIISYKQNVTYLPPRSLIATENNLYLKSDYFGKIFGLECSFNFRSLSIVLKTNLDLPIIREMRQGMMRSNIRQLKGEFKADTVVRQRSPFFHLGVADWSVVARQQTAGTNETRLNLTLGSMVAGGETTIGVNYNPNQPFLEREQYYQWRLVNNHNPVLRQVVAGKYYAQSISSIYSPVVGVQFTNTPTSYRRSYGSYRLSNITEPGWMVELYMNDVLVNYVKADASGFFSFEVPLVYGNSSVKLRFYGPWGEERTREGNVTIPFNLLPPNEFEYTVSAGIVEDGRNSRYSRATVNYGLNGHMTVGGGFEYLSAVMQGVKSAKTTDIKIPFIQTALRMTSNLMLFAEYAHNVRTRGVLTYRRPSNLQLELNYTRYKKGQQAIQYNFLEERNLVFSMPFRTKNFVAFSRFTFNQKILPKVKYTTGELLLSATAHNISANLTNYSLYTESVHPLMYSNLSLNFRLPHRFTLTPQAQYEYSQKKLSLVKGQVEKQFSRNGYLTMSYEKNMYYHVNNAAIGMRYDFSFAQTGLSASHSNHTTIFTQSARGSLIFDRKSGYVSADGRSSIGRGGTVIIPFLDLNGNGRRDKDEPKAYGLKLTVREGYVQYNNRDTSIRISNLEPFINYNIALDSNSFDNIAWKLRKKSYSISIEPNQFKSIDVPVTIAGEVSGMVYLNGLRGKTGMARMIICLFNSDSVCLKQVLTESDGFFSYLGLPPGAYTARMDSAQLNHLHLAAAAAALPFYIRLSKEGDVADGLAFILHPVQATTQGENTTVTDTRIR